MNQSKDRMKLLRMRRKRGLRCVNIEVRETEVLELVRRGLVAEEGRNDLTAIRDGIHRFLDAYLVNP